jgi:hypothetical protein
VTSSGVKQPTKKIDLGAASTYGKSTDLGINSPTHRSTHSEDLFGTDVTPPTKTIKSSSDIENIFDNDDFNPRASEPPAPAGDFGDFESAFGKTTAKLPSVPSIPSSPQNADFADFSSAFTTNVPSTKATTQPLDDNFLFSAPPVQIAAVPIVPIAKSNDITADLFGNSVITSAFTSQSTKNDLLDDFADLKINTGNQGEFYC